MKRTASYWLALAGISLWTGAADARPVRIDIPAGTLERALLALSRQTGLSVGIAGRLPYHRTRSIKGTLEPSAALERLLRGSRLQAVAAGNGVWRLEATAEARRSAAPLASSPALDEIIVTGTKRDEQLASLPNAVTVLKPEAADRLISPRGVHDLIEGGEGAFATNLGPGRDRIFLRGVADSSFNGPTQSTVTLFLDEARVSYATPDPDIRLVDIDRVELLRGPQGTLYGAGALGGIVRIVPNKPDLDRWSGAVAAEGSATAHGGAGGALEFMVNAPIVTERLAIRAVGYGEHGAGWIDDNGRNDKNVNQVRRYGGRMAARWQFADRWTADVGIALQWINADDSQYATRGLTRSTALAEPHDNDFMAATLTIKGGIGDFDVASSSAYVAHEVESVYDASSVAPARSLPSPLGFSDLRELKLATQEWRISDPAASRPWVAGIALLTAENTYSGRFLPSGAAAISALSLHDDALEAAVFGEASQPLGKAFKLTLGGRLFTSRVDNEQNGQARRRARESGLTPSAALSWSPGDHALVWLRYASAIRPGGINPDGDPRLDQFRSDDLKSIELGWRMRADRFRMSGALFSLRWENLQSDIVGADGFIRTINAGKARNFGLELSTSLDLAPFAIEGHLTVQRGRLYRPSAAANAIGDDNRLPVLPDYAGRLKLSYHAEIGTVSADWFAAAHYVGTSRLSFDPGLARSMGGYWNADAGVTFSMGEWRAALTVSNLLDGRGNSFGFGNPFSIRLLDQRTPIRPRTVGLRIEKAF